MRKHRSADEKSFSRRMLDWYKIHQRSLPWRNTSDPYCIWVSEIMLQQTQVDTVIPYYARFLKAFPQVRALAQAPIQDVLKQWENLGYYSRARHLHAAAQIVVDVFGGRIPDTVEAIKTLPGIGDYTAGAILSIAYGIPVPAVDGNVRRILSRYFAVGEPVDDPRVQKELFERARALVPARRPGDFNQALMDLGATICRSKNPDCAICPLAPGCLANRKKIQNILPVKRKVAAVPHRQATAAVIWEDGKLLMVQRPAAGLLGSLWKLPGGFVEKSETKESALRRSVKEELGLSVRVGKSLGAVDHAYTHFRLTLWAFDCRLLKGVPKPLQVQDWRWATPDDLNLLPLSKVDRSILEACVAASDNLSATA